MNNKKKYSIVVFLMILSKIILVGKSKHCKYDGGNTSLSIIYEFIEITTHGLFEPIKKSTPVQQLTQITQAPQSYGLMQYLLFFF